MNSRSWCCYTVAGLYSVPLNFMLNEWHGVLFLCLICAGLWFLKVIYAKKLQEVAHWMKRVQIFIFWQGMKQVIEYVVTGCSDVARQFTNFLLYTYLPGCVWSALQTMVCLEHLHLNKYYSKWYVQHTQGRIKLKLEQASIISSWFLSELQNASRHFSILMH